MTIENTNGFVLPNRDLANLSDSNVRILALDYAAAMVYASNVTKGLGNGSSIEPITKDFITAAKMIENYINNVI